MVSGQAVTAWYAAAARRIPAPTSSPRLPLAAYPARAATATARRQPPATSRRRGVGNRYGPTYAVTSSSAGRASPSSVTPSTLRGPRGPEAREGTGERLG